MSDKLVTYAMSETLPGTCGVTVLFDFYQRRAGKRVNNDEWFYGENGDPLKNAEFGGAGWSILGFINKPESFEAYKEALQMWQVVLQSPVRKNKNSGNDFFFILVDTDVKKKEINNEQFGWPF